MGADFWLVLRWWGTLFLVGAAAWPLTRILFGGIREIREIGGIREKKEDYGWWDGGYLFSKAVGMAAATWIVYVLGTIRVMPFSVVSIGVAITAVFLLGLWGNKGDPTSPRLRGASKGDKGDRGNWGRIIIEEVFFLAALLFWSWIKAHEPSIRGLEKFMDFGFMQSILNSSYFPPPDMWYAGLPINYYYFGHLVTATTTKLSGLDLAYTFNLMLATIFALTLTMSFSIGYQVFALSFQRKLESRENKDWIPGQARDDRKRKGVNILAGLLTAFLVTMAGNMQTIYAFTRGYTGDPPAGGVKPFWELWWNIGEIGGIGAIWGKIGEGMNSYWYANATRFIPFTIHEFPGYSFVVSDVHGHVLSIPFVLLAIAILITMSLRGVPPHRRDDAAIFNNRLLRRTNGLAMTNIVFYGFLVGVLLMTNALDGPIYFGLLAVVLGVKSLKSKVQSWKIWGVSMVVVMFVAGITSLPFLWHFKSFVTGLAVNCPPAFLANTKIGPLLFEGVEKCQISPFWMWWLLWGFFVYCGVGMIVTKLSFRPPSRNPVKKEWIPGQARDDKTVEKVLFIFFVFALALVIVPEFFYFKDIYPMHFRSNTMFKLGYQAFILFSIVSGYAIVSFSMSFPRKRESIFLGLDPRLRGDDKRDSGDDNIGRYRRILFFIFLLPQLFLVSIFPIFSVRSYFNSLRQYQGLYGFVWMQLQYPDDWAGVEWLNQNAKCQMPNAKCENPVIVEADGDSYTDYARFSAFTGIPTVIGWPVHEWLWRGGYDVVAPRREEVRQIYESNDLTFTQSVLKKYSVRYIVVGALERQKYKSLQETKFALLGNEVFRSGRTVVYHVQ